MAAKKSAPATPNRPRTGFMLAPMMKKGAQQKGAPKSRTT